MAGALIGATIAGWPAGPAWGADPARRAPPRAAAVQPPAAIAARPAPRRDPPLPPLCDAAGEMRIHRVGLNLAEVEEPDAPAVLQSAMQLCVSATPLPGQPATRGPVWRG